MSVATGRQGLSLPLIVALLLAVSAGLFAAGVAVEHASATPYAAAGSGTHAESGEEGGESGEQKERATPVAGAASGTSGERVWGIAVESPVTVTVAVVVSLLLAAAVWRRPRRPVLAVAAVFAIGATVFDIAEVSHQVHEERVGIAALAVLVALLHLAAAVAAGVLLRTGSRTASA